MSEIIASKRKRSAVILSSDDDSEEHSNLCKRDENYDHTNLPDCRVVLSKMEDDVSIKAKKKARRIQTKFLGESSSDDENEYSKTTPSKIQMQRKRLENLCKKKRCIERSSRRLRQDSSSSQKSEIDESNSDIDIKPLYTEKQEENLPMFKHEEKPPDSDMSSEDDNDFINDDESIDESSDSKSEKDSVIVSEDSNSYMNPYMERNNEFEREDIMKILSKSTEKDRNNQKSYENEIGKYQLQIHSTKNRAHSENRWHVSEQQRYDRIMGATLHDEALKEERNIENGDWVSMKKAKKDRKRRRKKRRHH